MKYFTVKENLERYYGAVIKEPNLDEYIKKVADYIDFVHSVGNFRAQIRKFQKESEHSISKVLLEKQILGEKLAKFVNELDAKLVEVRLKNKKIDNIFTNDIYPMLEDQSSSSMGKEMSVLTDVYDILRILQGTSDEVCVSGLAELHNYQWNLSIDNYIKSYETQSESHDSLREKEIWGCWMYLKAVSSAYSFIHTHDYKGLEPGRNFKDKKVELFYYKIFNAVRSGYVESRKEIKIQINSKLERTHTFLLRKNSEDEEAKIWTKRGVANVFAADVSNFIVNIVIAVVSVFLGYWLGMS